MRLPIAALAAAVLFADSARAQDEPQSYGGQVFLADLAAIGVGVAAITQQSRSLGAVAAAMYLIDAPVIHALHGRSDRIGRSLGVRLGLPLGIGLVGGGIAFAFASHDEYGVLAVAGGLVLGGSIGLLTASVFDATKSDGLPAPVQQRISLVPGRRSLTLNLRF